MKHINPVTQVAAAIIMTTPLIFAADLVTPSVALGLGVVLLLVMGTPFKDLRLCWPLLIFAPLAGTSMLLYAKPAGVVHWQWGPMCISDDSIRLAEAMILRVLALGVPVILLFARIDGTALADGLAQRLRLPSRFVYGILAGLRTVGLVQADQRMLGMARRARGLADSGRVRRFASIAFGLLVVSLRRGSTLATAMEARGFGPPERTYARESRFGWRDAVLFGGGVLVILTAILTAVLAGSWRTLWG